LSYSFETELEEYDDKTYANFLVSEVHLSDLETYSLEDKNTNLRITIGWKSNQEDAYDFSGINIKYNRDHRRIKYDCIDGFGFGSVSTYVTNEETGRTV